MLHNGAISSYRNLFVPTHTLSTHTLRRTLLIKVIGRLQGADRLHHSAVCTLLIHYMVWIDHIKSAFVLLSSTAYSKSAKNSCVNCRKACIYLIEPDTTWKHEGEEKAFILLR